MNDYLLNDFILLFFFLLLSGGDFILSLTVATTCFTIIVIRSASILPEFIFGVHRQLSIFTEPFFSRLALPFPIEIDIENPPRKKNIKSHLKPLIMFKCCRNWTNGNRIDKDFSDREAEKKMYIQIYGHHMTTPYTAMLMELPFQFQFPFNCW